MNGTCATTSPSTTASSTASPSSTLGAMNSPESRTSTGDPSTGSCSVVSGSPSSVGAARKASRPTLPLALRSSTVTGPVAASGATSRSWAGYGVQVR